MHKPKLGKKKLCCPCQKKPNLNLSQCQWLTKEDIMNSCVSFRREKNTEEVIPAKQVTAAVLTLKR